MTSSYTRTLYWSDEHPYREANAKFGISHAVIIGIDAYDSNRLRLDTCVPDARRLGEILGTTQGYEDVRLLLDQDASLKALREFFKDLPNQVGEDDRLLLYYAGHGVALPDQEQPSRPEGFLIPQDARPGDSDTFLPMRELNVALEQLTCRHVLLVLDCCYAGAFHSGRRSGNLPLPVVHRQRFQRYASRRARQILTSSSAKQEADSKVSIGDAEFALGVRTRYQDHSPFAAALFEALQGSGDTNDDGLIPLVELYAALVDRMPDLMSDQGQDPQFWSLDGHASSAQFFFLMPNHPLNLPVAPAFNPWQGDKPYDADDAKLFSGRDGAIAALKTRLASLPLTILVGPSGSGKTSLLQAGLLPSLQDASSTQTVEHLRSASGDPAAAPAIAWQVKPLPIHEPCTALAQWLKEQAGTAVATVAGDLPAQLRAWSQTHPRQRLLLILDPLEQLLDSTDEPERAAFLDLLGLLAEGGFDQVTCLLALRSDNLPVLRKTSLAVHLESARVDLGLMQQDSLREVITQPSFEAVVSPEPDQFVERLVNDVVGEPGGLAILSQVLHLLYLSYRERAENDEADDFTLREQDLEQVIQQAPGGVPGFVVQQAIAIYQSLDENHQATMRRVLLRMADVKGAGLGPQPVRVAELTYPDVAENARVEEVIRRLVEARLLVRDEADAEPIVMPAHQALVSHWKLIEEWRGQADQALRLTLPVRHQLSDAAQAWHNVEGPLWHDSPLLPLLAAVLEDPVKRAVLNKQEYDFVTNSIGHKRKRQRNRQLAVGGFIGFLILAIAVSWFLFFRAERAAAIARARQLAAQSAEVRERFPQQSLLLAVEAVGVTGKLPREPVAEQALRDALAWAQGTGGMLLVDNPADTVGEISFPPVMTISPDGKWLASFVDGHLMLQDLAQATSIALPESESRITELAFNSDSRWLAASLWNGQDYNVRIWQHTKTWTEACNLGPFTRSPGIAFDVEASRLATLDSNGLQLWDTAVCRPLLVPTSRIEDLAVLLGFAGADRWLVVWRPGRGQVSVEPVDVCRQPTCDSPQRSATEIPDATNAWLSPDGRRLATGGHFLGLGPPGSKSRVLLWDLSQNQLQPIVLECPLCKTDEIQEIEFSSKANWLAAVDDTAAYLWRYDSGSARYVFDSTLSLDTREREVLNSPLRFTADERWVAITGKSGRVWIWDLTPTGKPDRKEKSLSDQSAAVTDIVTSPDSRWIAVATADQTVRLWTTSTDVTPAQPKQIRIHDSPISKMLFSPDGKWFVTAGDDGMRLWQIDRLRSSIEPILLRDSVLRPDLSRKDLEGSPDRNTSSEALRPWDDFATEFKVSPDGHWLIKGDEQYQLRGDESVTPSTFAPAFSSPDGRWMMTLDLPMQGDIFLYDLTKDDLSKPIPLKGHVEGPRSVWSFSADSRWLVSGGDRVLRVWRLDGKQPVAAKVCDRLSYYPIRLVTLSPDGQQLATVDSTWFSDTVAIWNLGGRSSGCVSAGSQTDLSRDSISKIAFTRDGRRLVATKVRRTERDHDIAVAIWDVAGSMGLDEPIELLRQTYTNAGVPFQPDEFVLVPQGGTDRWLALASGGGQVFLSRLRLDDLISLACQTAGRNLSEPEWRLYMGAEVPYRKTCDPAVQ